MCEEQNSGVDACQSFPGSFMIDKHQDSAEMENKDGHCQETSMRDLSKVHRQFCQFSLKTKTKPGVGSMAVVQWPEESFGINATTLCEDH